MKNGNKTYLRPYPHHAVTSFPILRFVPIFNFPVSRARCQFPVLVTSLVTWWLTHPSYFITDIFRDVFPHDLHSSLLLFSPLVVEVLKTLFPIRSSASFDREESPVSPTLEAASIFRKASKVIRFVLALAHAVISSGTIFGVWRTLITREMRRRLILHEIGFTRHVISIKVNRMLIRRWQFLTPEFRFLFFFDHSIVFTCSKVINAFKR